MSTGAPEKSPSSSRSPTLGPPQQIQVSQKTEQKNIQLL